jgi:hypothetical protein
VFIDFNAVDDGLNEAFRAVCLRYAPSVEEPISVTVSGHVNSRYEWIVSAGTALLNSGLSY